MEPTEASLVNDQKHLDERNERDDVMSDNYTRVVAWSEKAAKQLEVYIQGIKSENQLASVTESQLTLEDRNKDRNAKNLKSALPFHPCLH
jgi:hypothetical protein